MVLSPLDDPTRPIFTVGQVADMLDVQQAFLRRLESHDLVTPGRSEGNQRRYSRVDIDRVTQICGLIDEGLTLAGVTRVLQLQAEVAELKAELAEARRQARTRQR
ncbi:MAG TPA: MerR family transcriptional regulator [Mycobacteriales bacterium]|nr:MerR family transcriptional regulator [Mycobacteriales bacterium]